jgi:hypothetical protein
VAFSLDGRNLASSSHEALIWDAVIGVFLQELRGHSQPVCEVAFSPDGRHLASASNDHTLPVWDIVTGASLRALKGHTDSMLSVAYSFDRRHWPPPLGMAQCAYVMWQQQSLGVYSKDILATSIPSHSHRMAVILPPPQPIILYVYRMWLAECLLKN